MRRRFFVTLVNKEYEEDGRRVEVYYIFGTVLDCDSFVVFRDGKLTSVEISTDTIYKTSKNSNAENGKTVLQKAFSFVAENNLAEFDIADLAYKGEIYSPFYDSWFYGWEFENGKYAGYAINVEKKAPHRVYIARSAESQPILFWCNGEYVDPVLSFLGKWRSSKTNEYIDIKSISKEGIVVFDLLVQADMYSEKTVLLENLSTEINEMPKSLDDCIFYEYAGEALIGDMQVFNGDVQSGYYVYAGDKSYLIDSLIMDYNGYVEYLPRGLTGRVGTGMLAFHIPESEYEYTQPSTFGYMENFGRDDPNEDSIIKNKAPSGESVINDYLNKEYETTGLKYADLEYTYLYDYAFAVNDRVYGVWESKDEHDPHYLYADSEDGVLIKECSRSLISRHTKELIYKSGTRVSGRTYAYQKYVTFDGKIVIDFEKRLITNNDSFVKEIEISDVGIDFVDKNERFMFFSDIGNRFVLNGYVLFDHTTWGATLHITDSNIPGFEIGIHYLNSETFFLDPSIGVVSMPEKSEDDKYIDDKLSGTETETKLVIREFGGKIIGYVYVDENGKKTVKEFSGKILGYYYPDRDVTTDFYGKIIARGDASSALLFNK
ncbi:MAG: hypothetical protein E7615_06365 [Ruminococcaceae bacterium]|nr:hypothetical protein [Oscillospiraceae bacterium]